METAVMVKQGHGVYVPSRIGGHDLVWQQPVSVITTHRGTRIRVDGSRSELVTSHGSCDVTDYVPAEVMHDGEHTAIVEYWHGEAARWEREAREVSEQIEAEANGMFEKDGLTINAPGFDSLEQFMAFVERATAAQLRTNPAGMPGTVMVQSSSSDAHYAVTRERCDCHGGRSHGRCFHRALVIWLADVQGVDVTTIPTIGVSKRGTPLTFGRRPAHRAEVA